MEGLLKQVLEIPKSSDFIDATTSGFAYDSLSGLDYLQYPHTEAFGMPSLARSLPFLTYPPSAPLVSALHSVTPFPFPDRSLPLRVADSGPSSSAPPARLLSPHVAMYPFLCGLQR